MRSSVNVISVFATPSMFLCTSFFFSELSGVFALRRRTNAENSCCKDLKSGFSFSTASNVVATSNCSIALCCCASNCSTECVISTSGITPPVFAGASSFKSALLNANSSSRSALRFAMSASYCFCSAKNASDCVSSFSSLWSWL